MFIRYHLLLENTMMMDCCSMKKMNLIIAGEFTIRELGYIEDPTKEESDCKTCGNSCLKKVKT